MLSKYTKINFKMAVLFIPLFLSTFSLVATHNYKPCNYEGVMGETHCLTESSYSYVACKPLREATGNISDKGLAWIPWGKLTQCRKPKSKCRCYVHDFWNWYDQDCECYNPSPVPDFPPIGVISWTGTYYDNDYLDPKDEDLRGEMHKLGNGNFMKKEFSSESNLTTFEILIADGKGRYTQYLGNTNRKACKIRKNRAEKNLQSIWGRFFNKDEEKEMRTSKKVDGTNKVIQIWKKVNIQGDWDEYWTWTVEFDDVTQTAIPVSFKNDYEDNVELEYSIRKHDYTFRRLEKEDKSFQLSDYCIIV